MYIALLLAVGLVIMVEQNDQKKINECNKILKEDHIEKIKEIAKEAIKK